MVRRLLAAFLCAVFLAKAHSGETDHYRLVTLSTPEGVPFEVGGLEVLADGRLAVCIRKGEVWLIDGVYEEPPATLSYKRIATALHEPLGLIQFEGDLYVAQRGELTRLRDVDGDEIIDVYECVSARWGISGNYHEYAYGPEIDGQGRFWMTLNQTIGSRVTEDDAWRGWGVTVSLDGVMTPMCAGMRSPCGLGANALGDMFFTDQQGNWVPAGSLHQLKPGAFYGHPDSLKHCKREDSPFPHPGTIPGGKPLPEAKAIQPAISLPAVWFPYRKVGMSATDIACDQTGGNFGPFGEQLFVGEFTMAEVNRVTLEKVNGAYQGACYRFRSGFQCAVLRMDWGTEGSLFLGQTNRGWNSVGSTSYGLQRLIWTGVTPFEIKEMRLAKEGFLVEFTQPVDPESASDPASYAVSSYTYEYHVNYGSDEIDARDLVISSADLDPDGRTVHLQVEGLRPIYVHELHAPGVRSETGATLLHEAAYYTLNQLIE